LNRLYFTQYLAASQQKNRSTLFSYISSSSNSPLTLREIYF